VTIPETRRCIQFSEPYASQGSTAVYQVNLRLALSVQFHTRWHFIAIYGSICLWLAFVCAYNALPLGTLGSIAHQVVPPPAEALHMTCMLACERYLFDVVCWHCDLELDYH
jgi:hypothetical protein